MDLRKILLEFSKIKYKYPDLHFKNDFDEFYITGTLNFSKSYNNVVINDSYKIKISIPSSYPKEIPTVFSIDNKIPKDYHTNSDKSLCLEVDQEIFEKLNHNINLDGFIENFIIPYFYRYSYICKYKQEPWPDRPHGIEGLLKYYEEKFSIKDKPKQIIIIFDFLFNKQYRGHLPCPCGSNIQTRKCHADILLDMKKLPLEYLKTEKFIIDYLKKEGIKINEK